MKTDRPYQICNKCILSTEDDPDIRFDELGICNHCHLYDEQAVKRLFPEKEREQRLGILVEKIKQYGKGKEYDCVIGVSGGTDSTYVAYLVKEVLGLRPLAVHCDNGWNSELAVSNISSTIKKLNIDLVTYVINWEEFKDLQLAYLKASVIDIEATTDHAVFATLYEIANQHGIKYILSGENFLTEGVLPEAWIHNKNDLINIKAIYRRFGKNKRFNTYPRLGILRKFFYEKIKNINYIRILDYVPYSKSEAKRINKEKFEWRDYGGKHYESIITRFYQSYILPVKFGVDKRRSHLSTLICSKEISRETALAEVAHPTYQPEKLQDDKEYVVKKFGLTMSEFEAIMAQPVKSHLDYPSFIKLMNAVRPFARTIRGILSPKKQNKNPAWIKKGRKIAMLLDNVFTNDNRVLLEAKTLAEKFDLTVYALQGKGLLTKEIKDGIKIHRIFPEKVFKIQSVRTIQSIARIIEREKYDVLHCHDHLMLYIGSLIKKKIPDTVLIYDSHELFHSWPINYSSGSLVIRVKSYLVRKYQVYREKKSSKNIDYLVTVNNSLADILGSYFQLKSKPIILRNLQPYEKANSGKHILRKKFNIPSADKILIYIGMHVYPKTLNIEAVIDQVGNKPGISFVLICLADSYRKYVEDYAAKKGYRNIYFNDVIEPKNISAYLADCDLGIISTWNKTDLSYWYALDNKLFNYLIAEIPILATAQPEYKRIIEKHGLGICINPDEPDAYYHGLEWVLQNYAQLKQNIIKAKEELNWATESKGLLNLYESLVVPGISIDERAKLFLKPRVAMLLDNNFALDKRVNREATAIAKAGYTIKLFAVYDPALPNEEIVEGVEVKRIFHKSIFDIKRISNHRRIAKRLSSEKIDVIHCHDWVMLSIGSLVKKINPEIILISDSHELFYSWPINYSDRNNFRILLKSYLVRKFEVWREKRNARRIDYLITVSTSFGEKLKTHFHLKNDPVIVKNIAEKEEITTHDDLLRKRFNIPSTTKVIVNFSLYIYQKSRNLEAVIDQFANVEGVALVFICKDGGNKKEIMNIVNSRNIRNIFFHEAIFGHDIVNTLSTADIGIVTTWNKKYLSYWLGLENKVFQYTMAEIPILATAQPEHIQVIEKYNLGVCVNADKPNAYLKGYYDVLNHYDEYKKNVIATKQFLHWDNEKTKLTGLYQTIQNRLNGIQ